MEFKDLKIKGMVFTDVYEDNDRFNNDAIIFVSDCGETYVLTHEQQCCEDVNIESIGGDLEDLIGVPLLMAEEAYKDGETSDWGTSTWSFYKFATVKGYVTIRFFGESNGYYSESADLMKLENNRLWWIY